VASEIVSGTGARQLAVASLVASPFLLPIVWLRPEAALLTIIAAAAFIWWFCRFLMRHLGGVTGDCLGFAVYSGQLIVLLCMTSTWPAA
jgi:cobalamin synthase